MVLMSHTLGDDDVIDFQDLSINGQKIVKFSSLKNCLDIVASGRDRGNETFERMVEDNVDCMIMTADKAGWRKGKIKIVFQVEIEDQE